MATRFALSARTVLKSYYQICNSTQYVSYKDLKALMAELKAVYAAVDENAALDALEIFKVTKAKSVFPTDDSLLKMLYLAMMDITKKWTGRRQDWSIIHAQLAVYFADRMPD